AEQQYRTLVESASDLVWAIDKHGNWTFLNTAAKTIFGIAPEDLVGTPALERTHPDYVDDAKSLFSSILEGEHYTDRDVVFLDASGETGHLGLAAHPLRNADGEITGAHGTARDVSVRTAAREALQRAREDAEQAASAKTAFLANTSHELRTPLNGILGMLELLLESELDDQQARSVDAARESAENLLEILNDILDVSKIEANRMEFVEVPFDVIETASSAIRTVALHAFTKDLKLVLDVHPAVPAWATGDSGRIRQILTNLLGNAVKFTQPGGDVVLTISSGQVTREQALYWFVVRDSGIGIAEKDLDAIFEEFVQADTSNTRRFGGAGLGLTISKKLAELMGGTLDVSSKVGEGTTFTVTIPMWMASSGAKVDRQLPERFDGKLAVVVVEHDKERTAVANIAKGLGMNVATAAGKEEGLVLIQEERMSGRDTALLILDGTLPNDGTLACVETLRKDKAAASIPIICLVPPPVPGGDAIRVPDDTEVVQKPAVPNSVRDAILRLDKGPIATKSRKKRAVTPPTEKRTHRLRILLADDSAVNQTIAATMLKKRGHTVDAVGNGKDAVDAVSRSQYDVVLMDIQMPEMDGLEATGAIRSHPAHRNLPIVALTAHALEEERDRCLAAGMSDFLSKPFRAQELFAIVEKWGEAQS
ncbi:MAG: response regulator, partial [Gemmatimonadota bacterium]|nr:response regulator [Gemmatimonadota bacterium]